ncbi:MAG: ribosome maturation factor RimM [Actinomycetota bacterium]|nr:ribosome maturation factor RimM [Actinomycetota bacterium]
MAKPHGLAGEVIVELVTDRRERLAAGSVLHRGGEPLVVVASRPHQRRYIVAFAGVHDRHAADGLRGALLLAEPLEDPAALWVHELIGSSVVDLEGSDLGTVVAVEDNPASDLLVLDGGALVPLRFVVESGPERVVVDVPDGLLD